MINFYPPRLELFKDTWSFADFSIAKWYGR